MGNITDYRTITYFDVETTSLDASKGEIIQICIVTEDADGNLHSRNYVYQVVRESEWLIVN